MAMKTRSRVLLNVLIGWRKNSQHPGSSLSGSLSLSGLIHPQTASKTSSKGLKRRCLLLEADQPLLVHRLTNPFAPEPAITGRSGRAWPHFTHVNVS